MARTTLAPLNTLHHAWLLGVLACVASVLLVVAPTARASSTISAVTDAGALPKTFVPNWDGHSDSTVISYHLAKRSFVRVSIVDARSRVVATIDAGPRDAGTHLRSWDGRGRGGAVQPAGAYRVQVVARPLAELGGASEPGSASLGGVVVAGSRAATITLQAPPVSLDNIALSRAALGRAKRNRSTQMSFRLSAPASVAAAIVGPGGIAVRTLAAGAMPAGSSTLSWNGRTVRGALVPEGAYELVVAASGPGRPTATSRLPIKIDRTIPRLRATKSTRARVGAGTVTIPLTLVLDEAATVFIRIGARTTRRTLDAGTHRLTIPGGELGLHPAANARTLTLRSTAVDVAGNAVFLPTTVIIAATAKPAPKPPPAQQPSTDAPVDSTPVGATGTLPWPVGGIVTSEFGMRDGRPHQGLDIAAPTGSPINSIAPGTISFMGSYGGYGNLVIVEHAGGLRTYYAHMSRFGGYGVGSYVSHINVIGYVGCTGTCSGPHLHFETRMADVPRPPRTYLKVR